MGRKNKGKGARKARGGVSDTSVQIEEDYKGAPHSFIFHRGQVGKSTKQLIHEMRRVMEPYTATHLKVRRSNVLKDFVNMAGPLNISHFMVFTKTEQAPYMRLMRLPRGPTISFKMEEFCLSRDIISSLKRHNMDTKQFQQHPLLVMNNMSGEGMHLKLMASMFQNMFPAININKVRLSTIRRCVLLNFNKEDDTVEFRHYNVKVVPVGMSRGIKKLVRARVPDMGKLEDVSDYLLQDGAASESEAELDGPHNEVELPQQLSSRGNIKAAKSAIRLTEIGPRLTLRLVKIQEGLCDGEVMYHKFISKTEEEVQALKQAQARKRKLKEKRKKKQEENVRKKQKEHELQKQKSLAGMKRKEESPEDSGDSDAEAPELGGESDSEDDVAYYKDEVGEMPDADLGLSKSSKFSKRKHKDDKASSIVKDKRRKMEAQSRDAGEKSGKKKNLTEAERLKKIKLKKKQKKLAARKKKGGNRTRRK